jgi:hypothetical protein
MFARLVFVLFLTTLILSPIKAQTTAPARDPQALTLIASSLKALTGSVTVNDLILQATAAYVAGSDEESGTATLTARGNQQSLVQLNLSGGPREEIRNGVAGVRVGPDGTPHAMAMHNCFLDADWFYPALSLEALANDPTLAVTLVGLESRAGGSVYHLMLFHDPPEQIPNVALLVQRVSAMHLYLDVVSLLPVALDFNDHLETDANTNFPVEIRFAAYQSFNGVQVPTHVQKYMQNSLVLDLTVSNVAVNSGVPASAFTLPPSSGGAQ